jgi:hypothetical protein
VGVILSFWDATGEKLDGDWFVHYFLGEDFCLGRADVFEAEAEVEAPAGARYVAFELGTFGIVTRRVALPE